MPRQRSYNPAHRPCTICKHKDRALIEAARVAGVAVNIVADKYKASRDAILRHMRNHVPEEVRLQYIADIPIRDLAAKAAEEGLSVLDYFSLVRAILLQQFQLAASLNDRNATANLGRTLTEVNREIGKLTGELLRSSPVTNINQTVTFINSPLFTDLQGMLVRKLGGHPEALAKVLEGLDELESKAAQPALGPPIIDGKALEGSHARVAA